MSKRKQYDQVLQQIVRQVNQSCDAEDRRMLVTLERWSMLACNQAKDSVDTWLKQVVEGPIPTRLQIFREAQVNQSIKLICREILERRNHQET